MYKKVSGSVIVFLVLFVDVSILQFVKIWLSKNFSMKGLGEAAYILGIMIYRDRSKRLLGLSQSTYIENMLKRFSMAQGITLLKSLCPRTRDERTHMSFIPYALVIESIMYDMICTRPDVSYTLSVTSRYHSDYCQNSAILHPYKFKV